MTTFNCLYMHYNYTWSFGPLFNFSVLYILQGKYKHNITKRKQKQNNHSIIITISITISAYSLEHCYKKNISIIYSNLTTKYNIPLLTEEFGDKLKLLFSNAIIFISNSCTFNIKKKIEFFFCIDTHKFSLMLHFTNFFFSFFSHYNT